MNFTETIQQRVDAINTKLKPLAYHPITSILFPLVPNEPLNLARYSVAQMAVRGIWYGENGDALQGNVTLPEALPQDEKSWYFVLGLYALTITTIDIPQS